MTNKTKISFYFILITLLLRQSGYAYSDTIASNFFKKATRELNVILPNFDPNLPISPTNYKPFSNITDIQYQKMKAVINGLDELDNLLAEFLTTLPTNVRNKVDALPQDKKFAFMFDFEKRLDDINELELDITLIDVWDEFTHLQSIRKELKYLIAYKRFLNNFHEIEHIIYVKNKSLPPNFTPAAGHSYENILNGSILDPNTIGLPSDMQSSLLSNLNGHKTYENMWFKFPNGTSIPTSVPPATNNIKEFPIGSGIWYKKKKGKNTIWNQNWDNQRIKEELAYLWVNKQVDKLQRNTNEIINGTQQTKTIFISKLTDGTEVEFTVNNIFEQFNQTYPYGISYIKIIN